MVFHPRIVCVTSQLLHLPLIPCSTHPHLHCQTSALITTPAPGLLAGPLSLAHHYLAEHYRLSYTGNLESTCKGNTLWIKREGECVDINKLNESHLPNWLIHLTWSFLSTLELSLTIQFYYT